MAKFKIGGTESSKGITITYEGHTPEQIAQAVNRLGRLPVGAVSGPVRKSASAVQRLAKSYAPRRTGALKVGLVVGRKERTSKPGKVAYDVIFAREMNDVFAKTSKITGKRAYYPSSMEYGFKLRDGKRYTGKYYLRTASLELEQHHEQIVVDGMWKKLTALWEKENGGSVE